MASSARVLLWTAVHLFACDSGNLMTVNDPRSDAEPIKLDAGLHADAAEAEDASPSEPDASVDAGEETCACPTLPPSCEQPLTDRPHFSPGDPFLMPLMNLLACAGDRVHLAMYETELPCVVDALITRLDANPDLVVDIVMDDDRCARGTDGRLACALDRIEGRDRVTIVDDARSRYMHHKFAVIDGTFLWTGSGNLTARSLCTDYNDAVVIDRGEIVAAYEAEFDRMFTAREFGPRPATLPHSGGPYRVYFGPESPLSAAPSWHTALITAIDEASVSIDLMVFAWTHTDIADALIRAYGRGVTIRGVVAPSYVNDDPAEASIAAGLPIRTASVHSKAVIIDEARVITGTPNWSLNSWANDEASVWIEDPATATAYSARFDEIWTISQPP